MSELNDANRFYVGTIIAVISAILIIGIDFLKQIGTKDIPKSSGMGVGVGAILFQESKIAKQNVFKNRCPTQCFFPANCWTTPRKSDSWEISEISSASNFVLRPFQKKNPTSFHTAEWWKLIGNRMKTRVLAQTWLTKSTPRGWGDRAMVLGCCGIDNPGVCLCLWRKCSKLWSFCYFWVSFGQEIHFSRAFRSRNIAQIPDLFCSGVSPGDEERTIVGAGRLTLWLAHNLGKSRRNGFQNWSFHSSLILLLHSLCKTAWIQPFVG